MKLKFHSDSTKPDKAKKFSTNSIDRYYDIANNDASNNKLESLDCEIRIFRPNDKHLDYGTNQNKHHHSDVSVSDIIGAFGWFHLMVLLFSALRESAVGYDAVVMSIILQPEPIFLCADNLAPGFTLYQNTTLIQDFNETAQCYKPLRDASDTPIQCSSWVFPQTEQMSLVAEWSLVCHQHWLVAFIESAYFFGLVTGNLVWGYFADKVGRRRTYLVAHGVSLFFGWISVFVPTIELFALCRFFSAFGSISYNIIYSIQVEIIGTKYRSFSTTLNHLGWGLGVILVPAVNHLFLDHHYLLAVSPVLTLLTYPWAFWLPESSRWLMANAKFAEARQELIRAARFNGKHITPALERDISLLQNKITNEKMKQEASGNKQSYRLLFTSPNLTRDTIILSYVSFTGHMFYYMLTINFAYMKNLSMDANFIISGAGEWVSVIVGAALLRFFSRRTCMSLFLIFMASSFLFQSLIDSGLEPSLDTQINITLNNAIGTLSALLLVFVVLIVNQEVYPTIIRQTGSSIVNTFGESGSTLAPMLIQLARTMGLWKTDLICTLICLVGVVGIQYVTKTDDIELLDT